MCRGAAVPVREVETGRMDTKAVGHCVCLVPRCTFRVAQYMAQAVYGLSRVEQARRCTPNLACARCMSHCLACWESHVAWCTPYAVGVATCEAHETLMTDGMAS